MKASKRVTRIDDIEANDHTSSTPHSVIGWHTIKAYTQ